MIDSLQFVTDLKTVLESDSSSFKAKKLACQCLTHVANVRTTIFDDRKDRLRFVNNMQQVFTNMLAYQNQYETVFKQSDIAKEFISAIVRFQVTFPISDMFVLGDK